MYQSCSPTSEKLGPLRKPPAARPLKDSLALVFRGSARFVAGLRPASSGIYDPARLAELPGLAALLTPLRCLRRPGSPSRRPLSVPPRCRKGKQPQSGGTERGDSLEEGGRRKDRRPTAEDRSERAVDRRETAAARTATDGSRESPPTPASRGFRGSLNPFALR